mmetsp:Transcript_56794/g.149159  ORF Transcript_56794/g.149159 Transcript_56794/m.149159 type:complete len:211 (+) Transcript_56794:664-1296(+)
MNSTPPAARLHASAVSWPVSPWCDPMRSLRDTSISWPVRSTPSERSMRATSRATVVLPVPGLPRKSMCSVESAGMGRPASLRSFRSLSCAISCFTNCLTDAIPTMASSLASTSEMEVGSPASVGSTKSASSSVVSVPRETVPIAKTRLVWRPMAASTMLRTSRPLPLLTSPALMMVCTREVRRGSSSASSMEKPLSRVICRQIPAISCGE